VGRSEESDADSAHHYSVFSVNPPNALCLLKFLLGNLKNGCMKMRDKCRQREFVVLRRWPIVVVDALRLDGQCRVPRYLKKSEYKLIDKSSKLTSCREETFCYFAHFCTILMQLMSQSIGFPVCFW